MKETVKQWLIDGEIDLFVGYRRVDGHPLPHCFTPDRIDELDDLVVGGARYPLEKIATHIHARHPETRIGILARDCTQRAINVLTVWNQLDPDRVRTINVNCCPSDLREHADCSYLDAEPSGSVKRAVGVDNTSAPADLEALGPADRLSRWMYEFQKCIKCYGCRNICPVCFCRECSLAHEELVGTGFLPPEIPIFHLVRAVHMAGRCIDCGLCEAACPADIPLRLLYRKVNEIVADRFDYRPGTAPDQSPFSIIGDKVTLTPAPMAPVEPAN